MKAAVVTALGKLEVLDLPMPELGPYDVLCRMCYGSTCAGTDIHLMDGQHPYPVTFPTVLGHESVGRVVELGAKVKNYKLGDLVSRVGYPGDAKSGVFSNWGGFAEYGIAKDHWQMRRDGVEESQWTKYRVNQIIHPAIDEKTAPMIITWRETLSYDRRIGIGAGTRLLLIGSGANALAHCANAVNLGAEVTVVGSGKRRDDFEKLAICAFHNYRDEKLSERVLEKHRGEKFDMILDGVGASDNVNRLLPLLKKDGTLGVYGWNGRAGYAINPFNAANSFRLYSDGYDEEESNGEVQSMILQGKLDAGLWYDMDKPVPLENIANAYDSLRRHEALKYLIKLG